MTDIERNLLELQLKGLKDLLDFHVERAKLYGLTDEIQEITDELLDLISDAIKKLKEDKT